MFDQFFINVIAMSVLNGTEGIYAAFKKIEHKFHL